MALDAERFKENMGKGAKGMAAEGRAIISGLPLGKQVRPGRRVCARGIVRRRAGLVARE